MTKKSGKHWIAVSTLLDLISSVYSDLHHRKSNHRPYNIYIYIYIYIYIRVCVCVCVHTHPANEPMYMLSYPRRIELSSE